MSYNPIVRTTKCIRRYKTYLENKDIDESANVAGGELATSCAPIGGGKKVKLRNNKTLITKPLSERAYPLLHDPNLVVIESTNQERELLKEAGLKIEAGDGVHVVKDKKGRIKSALAVKSDDDNSVKEVRYIDADPNGKHFKGGLSRLATLPGKLSLKSKHLEVHRDEIKEGLVVND